MKICPVLGSAIGRAFRESLPQKTRAPTAIVHGDPPSQRTRCFSTDTRAQVYLHAYASTYFNKSIEKMIRSIVDEEALSDLDACACRFGRWLRAYR
jgi:hypothetical protein